MNFYNIFILCLMVFIILAFIVGLSQNDLFYSFKVLFGLFFPSSMLKNIYSLINHPCAQWNIHFDKATIGDVKLDFNLLCKHVGCFIINGQRLPLTVAESDLLLLKLSKIKKQHQKIIFNKDRRKATGEFTKADDGVLNKLKDFVADMNNHG